MTSLPACPRGCESAKVVRDGVQRRGGRERQRYRCVADDGTFHRFLGTGGLTRTRGNDQHCDSCERALEVDGGPVMPWSGQYQVREVASALWAVAGGASYTEAAARVRIGAWGHDGRERRADSTVASGQTVADWLSRYGHLVAAPHAETAWPETVVLDSTRFLHTNARTGTTHQLFCVLAAWGYPAGAARGRLWRVRAAPLQDAVTWESFLRELPGKPRLVVVDRDYGAIGGVQARWGRGASAVPIHLCEHHLYVNGRDALTKAGHAGFGDPLQEALATALASPDGWTTFHQLATAAGGGAARWAKHWDRRMRVQTARRDSIPAHYANGAVEAPLEEVKRIIGERRWTFRNQARLNELLELVRIRYNRSVSEADFTRSLRSQLADLPHGARPSHLVQDDPRLPGQRVSSSSLRAWLPGQPPRHQRHPAAAGSPAPPASTTAR